MKCHEMSCFVMLRRDACLEKAARTSLPLRPVAPAPEPEPGAARLPLRGPGRPSPALRRAPAGVTEGGAPVGAAKGALRRGPQPGECFRRLAGHDRRLASLRRYRRVLRRIRPSGPARPGAAARKVRRSVIDAHPERSARAPTPTAAGLRSGKERPAATEGKRRALKAPLPARRGGERGVFRRAT